MYKNQQHKKDGAYTIFLYGRKMQGRSWAFCCVVI